MNIFRLQFFLQKRFPLIFADLVEDKNETGRRRDSGEMANFI
jgi:hypothetical protein